MIIRDKTSNRIFKGYSASAEDGSKIWILDTDTGIIYKFKTIQELADRFQTVGGIDEN